MFFYNTITSIIIFMFYHHCISCTVLYSKIFILGLLVDTVHHAPCILRIFLHNPVTALRSVLFQPGDVRNFIAAICKRWLKTTIPEPPEPPRLNHQNHITESSRTHTRTSANFGNHPQPPRNLHQNLHNRNVWSLTATSGTTTPEPLPEPALEPCLGWEPFC